VLMSDAGGGNPGVSGATITFDQSKSPIQDAALAPGRYSPANYEGTTTDNFVTPAPAGPYGSSLNDFL